MFDQYLNLDEKRIGLFLGLIIGATIVVTLLYWAIFGFDRWTVEMDRASDLMMTAAVAPLAAPPTGAYTTPSGAYTTPSGAGQYVCPRDGAVGLPQLDAAGNPHCPVCGQVMNFYRAAPGNMAVAAAPG